ncbi:MAG TPA: polysaccharide biosynthesis/export family protein [Rhodocyclaceae bacterium]|nr:polysaccharide biosynthesis/export family protein [Rhodocyclaceae bacterium]
MRNKVSLGGTPIVLLALVLSGFSLAALADDPDAPPQNLPAASTEPAAKVEPVDVESPRAAESALIEPLAVQTSLRIATSVAAAAADAGNDTQYRVGAEDILEISVWKEEGLKKEVIVRPDGGISFPLVGEIAAAGKTAQAIGFEITDRLKKSILDPVVSVSVLKVAANKVYVIGRVARPGEYVAGRYLDVLQALAMAGGLTPYAAEDDIKVLRKRDGVDQTFAFQYSDVRKGRNLDQNIMLQSGDVVVVP